MTVDCVLDFAEIVNYVGDFSPLLLEGWKVFQSENFIMYRISNNVGITAMKN